MPPNRGRIESLKCGCKKIAVGHIYYAKMTKSVEDTAKTRRFLQEQQKISTRSLYISELPSSQ
ncbi:hypothetical protein P5673_011363 [Acropora cervicornis]|uniref:Uncharacterized protein n=1 Tax=Acropora cervicornis TaxID=6130 RepID=A0AAD9QQ53_ACRCE|nr:hypothetical protein P5673_011363 [Acropora cervicornis]